MTIITSVGLFFFFFLSTALLPCITCKTEACKKHGWKKKVIVTPIYRGDKQNAVFVRGKSCSDDFGSSGNICKESFIGDGSTTEKALKRVTWTQTF